MLPCSQAATHYTCSACSGLSYEQASFIWQMNLASSITTSFGETHQHRINNISPNPPIHRGHVFQHIFKRGSYQKVATTQPCNQATTHYTCSACSGPSFMQASFIWQMKLASSTPKSFGETHKHRKIQFSPKPTPLTEAMCSITRQKWLYKLYILV